MQNPTADQIAAIRNQSTELARAREILQIKHRHADVLERRLHQVLERAGLTSITVDVTDPILPLGDGISLNRSPEIDEPTSYMEPPVAPYEPVNGTDPAWWPKRPGAYAGLIPNAGWYNYTLHGKVIKVLAFSICGFERDDVEKLVTMVADQQAEEKDFVPIFLTDSTEFDIFRSYGFVFEYLPDPSRRETYVGSIPWDVYMRNRYELIMRKWGVAKTIVFGQRKFADA